MHSTAAAMPRLCCIEVFMAEKIMLDEGEYIGDVSADGLPLGRGSLRFFDGRVFSGEIDYAAQRGHGVWRYPDGSCLRGGFSICAAAPFWSFTFCDGRNLCGAASRFVSEGGGAAKDTEADGVCALLVSMLRVRGQSIEFNARALLVDIVLRGGIDAASAAYKLSRDEKFITVPQIMDILVLD